MNKKISITLFAFFICFTVFSQSNKTAIAPFKITLVNGKPYTYNQLKKNTLTAVIYFSPTCEHCKEFTEVLLKHQDQIKDKQLVMITYLPLADLKTFDSLYNLSAKPFFKLGTEGYSFIVRKYYNVERFPFVALYDKQMKLVKILPGLDKPEVLAEAVINFK